MPEHDRAFMVKVNTKGWLRKRVDTVEISDGYNTIKLKPYELFLVDTDKPITEAVIRRGV